MDNFLASGSNAEAQKAEMVTYLVVDHLSYVLVKRLEVKNDNGDGDGMTLGFIVN